jgi:5-methylcytosine-specific restriction endonuclease McrA
MQRVFVLDADHRPLMPCRPARARLLLSQHRAAVFRRQPFTIILQEARPDAVVTPLRLKIDPGSKTTGLAVLSEATGEVVWVAELTHRGQEIHTRLEKRAARRRARRQRKTRYRQARFLNRRRREGWLPPSLESRIEQVLCWVQRLQRFCPIGALSQELTRFDTQLLQNPDISGVEYQQGELADYEIREYVLEKFGRHSVYCHKTNLPLELDHLLPRSRGGAKRTSNLAPACHRCNHMLWGDQRFLPRLKPGASAPENGETIGMRARPHYLLLQWHPRGVSVVKAKHLTRRGSCTPFLAR